MTKKEYVIAYAGTGSLGYGFPEESLENALKEDLDFIGCDAGSVDAGPYYLGASKSTKSRAACYRDLELLLKGAVSKNIPLLIGSAGTCGNKWGVEFFRDMVLEIAKENHFQLKIALIYSDVDRDYLRDKLRAGKTRPLGNIGPMKEDDIYLAENVVGMMGVEPFIAALEQGAQVVIAGRASDTSIYSAIPVMHGLPKSTVWHAAKVIECGGAIALPKSSDGLLAKIAADHYIVSTPNEKKRIPVTNVAAHTMYENDHPYIVYEPNGYLDASDATYEQLDERTVKVSNSKFVEADNYTIKIEGAILTGYRSGFFAGIRDSVLIHKIDSFVEEMKAKAGDKIKKLLHVADDEFSIQVRLYGKNGVMGEQEFETREPYEIGMLVDVVAKTQELADTMITLVKAQGLHQYFDGRLCTAGNFAFPYSPQTMTLGPVYEFCFNHVVEVDDPMEMFRIELLETNTSGTPV